MDMDMVEKLFKDVQNLRDKVSDLQEQTEDLSEKVEGLSASGFQEQITALDKKITALRASLLETQRSVATTEVFAKANDSSMRLSTLPDSPRKAATLQQLTIRLAAVRTAIKTSAQPLSDCEAFREWCQARQRELGLPDIEIP